MGLLPGAIPGSCTYEEPLSCLLVSPPWQLYCGMPAMLQNINISSNPKASLPTMGSNERLGWIFWHLTVEKSWVLPMVLITCGIYGHAIRLSFPQATFRGLQRRLFKLQATGLGALPEAHPKGWVNQWLMAHSWTTSWEMCLLLLIILSHSHIFNSSLYWFFSLTITVKTL